MTRRTPSLPDLSQLDVNERAALVALTKAVILADGKVSDDEQTEVARISAALGDDHYRALMDVMDTRLPDEDSLKQFLLTITRQEARELIYGIVLEAATAGGVGGNEPQLLSWLEKTWNLQVSISEPGTAAAPSSRPAR
ncbi:MAG: hypothetical protein ABI560_16075 [Myxococcales bacterium]